MDMKTVKKLLNEVRPEVEFSFLAIKDGYFISAGVVKVFSFISRVYLTVWHEDYNRKTEWNSLCFRKKHCETQLKRLMQELNDNGWEIYTELGENGNTVYTETKPKKT